MYLGLVLLSCGVQYWTAFRKWRLIAFCGYAHDIFNIQECFALDLQGVWVQHKYYQ